MDKFNNLDRAKWHLKKIAAKRRANEISLVEFLGDIICLSAMYNLYDQDLGEVFYKEILVYAGDLDGAIAMGSDYPWRRYRDVMTRKQQEEHILKSIDIYLANS